MDDFDLDSVLNLEEEFYNEGFKEGQEFSTHQQYVEGKEYGYQTGFQRLLVIGYIQGLIIFWRKNISKYTTTTSQKTLDSHLDQLENSVKNIPLTNGDKEVAEYEKIVAKARNKLRVVATLCKENEKIKGLDDLIKTVGGQLQVSENMDEMW
ncbi:protein Lto1p [[Candida] anglica]|uniref:Protein Lto1p n=1 Tax=[Candida] anglica TaxID=148631 RepID=A0ABP0EC86_9ASCO